MRDYLKPSAEPIIENGKVLGYESTDVMMEFRIITKGKLILKNNSKNHAYNIEVTNLSEFFSEHEKLPKLTSLSPNEKIEIEIAFEQSGHFESGILADNLPDIPIDLENKILYIKYENEAGTKLLTKFWLSFTEIRNEQTYWAEKNPA